MDILMVINFTGNLNDFDNTRFRYLANLLVKEGHDVEVVTSTFNHGLKIQRPPLDYKTDYKVTLLYEPGYPKNVCFQRFRSHHIWGKNVKKYLRKRKKPDVIYTTIPSLTGPYNVAKYCKENNVRMVIDVQDLWPEAFKIVANIPVVSDIVFYPFTFLANGAYRQADAICAVSDSYCQRAHSVNKKCKTTTTVFLGTELDSFDENTALEPPLKKEKGSDEVWVAYCGTLGSSYDLTCVIDALSMLNNPKIKFIVMGSGPKQEDFKEYAESKGVNAVFTGMLKYDLMCSQLVRCDITVNPIIHSAAQSIINKHGDYAASGLPVISTQENEEYRKLVDTYQMGFNCENGNAEQVAEKFKLLVEDKDLRKRMGANARRCAEEKFDRKRTYRKLVDVITAVNIK